MGRFFDCQIAVVPWGAKAKFRRAKVGLLRRGSTVYLAMFAHNDNNKFPIDASSVEILPAAIRFRELEKDLFIRQASDSQRYETMVREIKVILKKEKLSQSGKAEAFNKFISSIPSFNTVSENDLAPARVSARLIGSNSLAHHHYLQQQQQHQQPHHSDSNVIIIGDIGSAELFSRPPPPSSCGQPAPQLISTTRDLRNANQTKQRYQQLDNTQLKSIKVSGLDRLPQQLWLLSALQELTLTDCNLTSVPKQLETFSNTLTSLDLSSNRINKVPRAFCCKMNNLRLMDLSHNQIETLPIEIKFFCRLVDLNISDNRLRMLPSTFSDLKSLQNLNVAYNNLSQLPAFRREDIRLKHLDVSYNPLDGALNEANTFEVHPSLNDDDGPLGYNENLYCKLTTVPKNKFPTLFEISMLNIVRCDRLLKLASEESLPQTIVSTMQRDIFKCYMCSRMSILPAYNSTDILDYVDQVEMLTSTGNYRRGMTFMKLVCRSCFDNMSS